jgi:uncharacterized protein (TIGR02147 family)
MKLTVFDYRDYKIYLNDVIVNRPERGRGMKSAIAEALGCQKAYVSQVLSGNAQFSLEQADSLNEFLGHSPDERHFFLLLIQLARAGKPSLVKYFEEQIKQIAENRLIIKERLRIKDTLSREHQAVYYSAWYYSAIHIMLGIERYQTKEALSKHLGLSQKRVTEVLDFLVSLGLAKQRSLGQFEIGPTRMHLERDSPMISKHHTNWRMSAIRSLERASEDELHYSVVASMSEEDRIKVKAMIVKFIQETMGVVHASKDEGVHCLALDFFPV